MAFRCTAETLSRARVSASESSEAHLAPVRQLILPFFLYYCFIYSQARDNSFVYIVAVSVGVAVA